MRKIKKLLAVTLTVAMTAALLAACGSSGSSESAPADSGAEAEAEDTAEAGSDKAPVGEPVTIRYGSADAEEAAVVQGLYAFKEYVEAESGGSIKVEPYINGVLGGDRELCEALQLGTVDMTIVMGGILANYDKDFNIFGLPYLWETKQASYDAVDGEFGDKMIEKANAFGFKLMGYGDGGAYHIGYTGKPIDSLDALKGLKIRVPEIDVDIAFFSGLGSTPTPISFSETYTALEQGVVNGLELSIELMDQSQFFDAIDNITLTNHVQCLFPILMAPSAWDKLSPEQQEIVLAGIEKQVEVNREKAADAEATSLEKFEGMGKTVVELSDDEMAKYQAVGEQIQDQYKEIIDPELIELARSYN